MLKLSLALDSPSLTHAWQPQRVQCGGGMWGCLQVLLGWVQGWLWRRVWCGWLERVQREDVGGQSGRGEALPSLGPALNLAGPAQSSLPLPPRKGVFWLLDGNRNAFFSTFLGHNWSLFYLYCQEDPSWPCSAECLAALWIPLFNCHLFRLWDP